MTDWVVREGGIGGFERKGQVEVCIDQSATKGGEIGRRKNTTTTYKQLNK